MIRVKKIISTKGEEASKQKIAAVQTYIYDAADKINKAGKDAINAFSEGDEQRMLLMGLKRFTKYANYPNVIELRNLIAEKLKAENRYCF